MWHESDALPSEVVCVHVLPLLEAQDLARLETAANKHNRTWLKNCCFPGTNLSNYKLEGVGKCEVWLSARNIKIKELTIHFATVATNVHPTALLALAHIMNASTTIHLLNFCFARFEDLETVTSGDMLSKVDTLAVLKAYSNLSERRSLQLLCTRCTNATKLQIEEGFTSIMIEAIAENFSALRSLSEVEFFASIFWYSGADKGLIELLQAQCPQLTKFASLRYGADALLMNKLPRSFGNLKELILVNGLKMLWPMDDGICNIATHCPQLQRLYLGWLSFGCFALEDLCQRCAQLKYLRIDGGDRLNAGALLAITTHAVYLEELHLPMRMFIPGDDSFLYGPSDPPVALPRLQTLTVQGQNYCPDPMVYARIGLVASLATALSFVKNNALDEEFSQYARAQFIEHINAPQPISRADLAQLAQHLHHLQSLEIDAAFDSNVSDADVLPILENNRNLRRVKFAEAEGLGDPTLSYIAHNVPRLEALRIERWKKVTDAGVAEVLNSCRYIRQVALVGCPLLSDAVLQSIPRNITSLEIQKCKQLSGDAIVALALSCRLLRELNIDQNYLTNNHLSVLKERLAKRCRFTPV